jgi:hypothetical protein
MDDIFEDMVMIPSADYTELTSDVEYWYTITLMLSELLTRNDIEFEVSEKSLCEYLDSKRDTFS